MELPFWILLALTVKHFVADSLLQFPYMYKNKGNWKHFGGYLHAAVHGWFTFFIFAAFGFWWFGLVDFVVHYIIDWCKVNVTKKYLWSEFAQTLNGSKCLAIYSNNYFHALIIDQCLHFATYIILASFI